MSVHVLWTARPPPNSTLQTGVAAGKLGNTTPMFISSGGTSGDGGISLNGIAWSDNPEFAGLDYGSLNFNISTHRFYLYTKSGVGNSARTDTTTGTAWTPVTTADQAWVACAGDPSSSNQVAIAANGVTLRSTGGLSANAGGNLPAGVWAAVTFDDALGGPVAIGSGVSATSIDAGASWSAGGAAPVGTYAALAYGANLATPVLTAIGTNIISWSTDDGATWHAGTIPAGVWRAITYDAIDGVFIAVGTNVSAYSTDGKTFVSISPTIPAGDYYGVAYSPDLALAVAVGANVLASTPVSLLQPPPAFMGRVGISMIGSRKVPRGSI